MEYITYDDKMKYTLEVSKDINSDGGGFGYWELTLK